MEKGGLASMLLSPRAFATLPASMKNARHPEARRIWIRVLGLTLSQCIAFGVTLNAFGILSLPLVRFFGANQAEAAQAVTAFLLLMTLTMPLAGWLLDRVSPRPVMVCGALLVSIGYGISAQASSLNTFSAAMGLAGIGIGLSTYVPSVTLITRWLPAERQGLAYGVMAAGIAAGGVLVPLILAPLVVSMALPLILQGIGGLVLLSCVPLLAWVTDKAPSATRSDVQEPSGGTGIGASLALRRYWLWVVMLVLISLSGISILMTLIPCLVAAGHTPAEAAVFHGGTAIATLIGSLAFGALSTRWGAERTLLLGSALGGVGILCLLGAGNSLLGSALAFLFVLLWGSTFNLVNQFSPVLLLEALGQRHFGSLLGLGNLISGVAAALGPITVGHLVDTTRSYFLPLLLCAALMAVALPVIARFQQGAGPFPSPSL